MAQVALENQQSCTCLVGSIDLMRMAEKCSFEESLFGIDPTGKLINIEIKRLVLSFSLKFLIWADSGVWLFGLFSMTVCSVISGHGALGFGSQPPLIPKGFEKIIIGGGGLEPSEPGVHSHHTSRVCTVTIIVAARGERVGTSLKLRERRHGRG